MNWIFKEQHAFLEIIVLIPPAGVWGGGGKWEVVLTNGTSVEVRGSLNTKLLLTLTY